jgi:hypothetical protein
MNFKLAEPASTISVGMPEMPVAASAISSVASQSSAPVVSQSVAPVSKPVVAPVVAQDATPAVQASPSITPSIASVDVQVDIPLHPPVVADVAVASNEEEVVAADEGATVDSIEADGTAFTINEEIAVAGVETASDDNLNSKIASEAVTVTADLQMPDVAQLWPKILDDLISVGQMTVYLFLLPAKPEIRENKLFVVFEEKDTLNYKELSSKQNVLIISKAVFTITGQHLDVFVRMSSDMAALSQEVSNDFSKISDQNDENSLSSPVAPTLPSNIESLKNSAEGLGITFYMED